MRLIEIDKNRFQYFSETKKPFKSPAIITFAKNRIITGEEASNNRFLFSTTTYSNFFNKLTKKPLLRKIAQADNHCDLAYLYLNNTIDSSDYDKEAFVAVPTEYDNSEISMLKSILKATKIIPTDFIDSTVLSLCTYKLHDENIYLKIFWDHLAIHTVKCSNVIEVTQKKTISNMGLSTIFYNIAKVIVKEFISQKRFNPLLHAESEQSLLSAMPQLISQSFHQDVLDIKLPLEKESVQLSLSSNIVRIVINNYFDGINLDEYKKQKLFFSDSFSIFAPKLYGSNESNLISSDACYIGLKEKLDFFSNKTDSSNLYRKLETSVPVFNGHENKNPATHSKSHILFNDRAYEINSSPLILQSITNKKTSSHPSKKASIILNNEKIKLTPNLENISVNGKLIYTETIITSGDTITMANTRDTLKVIEVIR